MNIVEWIEGKAKWFIEQLKEERITKDFFDGAMVILNDLRIATDDNIGEKEREIEV